MPLHKVLSCVGDIDWSFSTLEKIYIYKIFFCILELYDGILQIRPSKIPFPEKYAWADFTSCVRNAYEAISISHRRVYGVDSGEHVFVRRSNIGEKAELDYPAILEIAAELTGYISLIDKICQHNIKIYDWVLMRDSLIIIRASAEKLDWK